MADCWIVCIFISMAVLNLSMYSEDDCLVSSVSPCCCHSLRDADVVSFTGRLTLRSTSQSWKLPNLRLIFCVLKVASTE